MRPSKAEKRFNFSEKRRREEVQLLGEEKKFNFSEKLNF